MKRLLIPFVAALALAVPSAAFASGYTLPPYFQQNEINFLHNHGGRNIRCAYVQAPRLKLVCTFGQNGSSWSATESRPTRCGLREVIRNTTYGRISTNHTLTHWFC